MKCNRLKFLFVPVVAGVLAGCAVAPISSESPLSPVSQRSPSNVNAPTIQHASMEQFSQMSLYQRPPNRLFGIMQEQGSLDAVPDVAAMVDYQQLRKGQRAALASTLKAAPQWIGLGPDNNLGRVIDIAFHPQNGNIIYIASPGGGAYKTTNGGDSWIWLGGLPYQAISSIAIDPLNPDVVYFGTGHFNGSGSDLLSMGVYKTADGGATFSLLAPTVPTMSNTDWLRVTRVLTHPTTANLLFAGTTSGFFRSSDGGATWSKVSGASTYDIAIDPNNPLKMLRGKYDGSVSISTNAGANWSQTQIVPFDSATAEASIRTRVKYAKSAPGVVYAAVDQNEGELHKSVDGGLTWSRISTPAHNGTQGFHTNQLWVSPIDANHLIVGGVDLYKSLDGGKTFTKISDWASNSQQTGAGLTPDTPHADHNAVASPPDYSAANAVFYVGSDGGLFTTTNARTVGIHTGWSKSSGSLNISQYVGAAGRRRNDIDTLVGGLQDNGTLLNIGYQGWTRIASGDGGFAAIDPIEDVTYGQIQNGEVFRYGLALGLRTICAGITEADPASCGSTNTQKVNFYAPLELDPNNSSRLYFGANSLWESANPKAAVPTWFKVKVPVAGTTTGTASSNYINAISIHQADSNVVLVGHNDGQIFRTKNMLAATPTWTALVDPVLPTGRMVGALLVDPVDADRLYVGFAGYFADNLWRSDNGGTTWQNISTGLPPGSIYAITRHPLAKEKLHVGTIWGSYGSDDGGNTWPVANDGPYGTQIRRLFWLGNDTLVAATFGSGLGKATVAVSTPNTVVEYYHSVLDNYFITADPAEQAAVDSGAAGAFHRTGNTFKVGGATQVCRFYGSQSPGPNSHFYTADAVECASLKSQQFSANDPRRLTVKSWNFESNDFSTTSAVNQACAAGLVPVLRAYNNGFARGIDSNHRITTSQAAIAEVVSRGWVSEGVVMCAPA
jgi:hypothetical protein